MKILTTVSQIIARRLRPRSDARVDLRQEKPNPWYDEDNLKTLHNHDFVHNESFQRAHRRYLQTPFHSANPGNHHGRWNIHVVLWAAGHSVAMNADVVQLGVFEGAEASAIAEYTNFESSGCRMYLVDTFEGVPLEQWSEAEIAAGADSAQWAYVQQAATRDVYAEVVEKFQGFSNVKVIRGVVPDILGEIDSTSIGCLLLDLNCAYPEEKALNRLWDKVVTGGLIISDDYGHSRPGEGYYQQKLMFDEFAKSKGLPVLTLPTGHGLVIKC